MKPAEHQELFDDFSAALAAAPLVELRLRPEHAMAIIAQLQLALRHPDNQGRTTEIVRDVIEALGRQMPDVCRRVIAMGFDPNYDQEAGS